MAFTTFDDDGQRIDHFPLPQELGNHRRRCLSNQPILELYNASHDPQRDVTDDVMQWVESEASRHGWEKPSWFKDSCTGVGCWLSPRPVDVVSPQGIPMPETKYPCGLLYNCATDRWHTILFRQAPMPGGADLDTDTRRFKSLGHHTEGFDTKGAAIAHLEGDPNLHRVAREYEWDGNGIPALTELFHVDEIQGCHY